MPRRLNRQNIFFIGSFATQNYGDVALRKMLQRYSDLKGFESLFLGYTFGKWQFFNLIDALRKSACVVLGPGTLFQCKTSIRQNFYYLAFVFFAKIMGKKIIALGLGIDRLPTFVKGCVKTGLGFCNRLYLRDVYSFDIFANTKSNTCLKQMPDLLFFQPEKMLESAKGTPTICWAPALAKQQEGAVIKASFAKESYSLVVADPLEKTQVESFFERPAVNFSTEYLKIHQPSYILSMRFHVALKAISMGIPAILSNNQQKCIELAAEFDLPAVDFSDRQALSSAIGFVKCLGTHEKNIWVKKLAKYQAEVAVILEENYEYFFKKL